MFGLTVDAAGVARALALGGCRVWPKGIGERPDVVPLNDQSARSALLTWGMATMGILRMEGEMDEVKVGQWRVTPQGDRCRIESVDAGVARYAIARTDSDGDTSIRLGLETVEVVATWRLWVRQ